MYDISSMYNIVFEKKNKVSFSLKVGTTPNPDFANVFDAKIYTNFKKSVILGRLLNNNIVTVRDFM